MPLTPGTTDEFVAIAVKSGLRNAEELRNALAAFRREVRTSFETSLAELRAFRDYLVHNDVLTRWQCENLSAGRYKGFFLDAFKLLRHLRCGESYSEYAAEDVRARRRVVIRIFPPTIGGTTAGKPRYEVDDSSDPD
jgi:serine/threonine-protein kinase